MALIQLNKIFFGCYVLVKSPSYIAASDYKSPSKGVQRNHMTVTTEEVEKCSKNSAGNLL